MATKLKNLKIRKVDFVDEGANPDADIKIRKKKDREVQFIPFPPTFYKNILELLKAIWKFEVMLNAFCKMRWPRAFEITEWKVID